ncbi:hypothetical protein KM914_11955 [Virgibacillus pantothenticus]|uniref:hypothetical protein n=1 Tax=Virgibacillus pantothenticus TaxID=1473 RepID=UPI001C21395F|nr:hypothetical protein [Virgibacillus pantothenticus]MBU8567139.1 hypothetical protein [Virgibacillus pantothenticus]MBU8600829.1 hypothetical protein [Virgibacillus pantothenticus]MBU8635291.1 hypothetical protein [Virgibacillus pantothenticus]MBU8642991.1 hypothetical protein [Virgibacillus pantothenticus]MBU8646989.1 hypothetical protein [Virgibacillus pantothenticus]
MSKGKKESFFKKIFSSNEDCCSVEFEEVQENNEKTPNKDAVIKSDSSCCSSKTE